MENCRTVRHKDEFGDTTYYYRGVDIRRNTKAPAGYWNSWRYGLRGHASTLAEAKIGVDQWLAERGITRTDPGGPDEDAY